MYVFLRSSKQKTSSINQRLLLWFLLLTLLPLIIVTGFNFYQTKKTLTDKVTSELEQSAQLTIKFIKHWFNDVKDDIHTQSALVENQKLLAALSSDFQLSGLSLPDYINSNNRYQILDNSQSGIVPFSLNYDYIYDILLIDSQGNVLYSIAERTDLGTNIVDGVYANSQFVRAYQKSVATKQTVFSDIERYLPSEQGLASFITTPIQDERGIVLGALAVQLRLDKIDDLLQHTVIGNSSTINHYIVGEDGLLRTPLADDWSEVLKRQIDTEQFKFWYQEYGSRGEFDEAQPETVFQYVAPSGELVFGRHASLSFLGTKWVLITEIDSQIGLESANIIGKVLLAFLVFIAIIFAYMAAYQAKRITRLINTFIDVLNSVSDGKSEYKLVVDSDDEIGQLSAVINQMIDTRGKHNQELIDKTIEAETELKKLSEQQYALDQYAIVAVTDVTGTIMYANDKFSQISGYQREELIGQNHRILNSDVHDGDFFKEMYRTIAQGKVWHAEICNKAKDGDLYWVDTTIVPFMTEDGKPRSYTAIQVDITQKKQDEVELQAAIKKLQGNQALFEQEENIAKHVFDAITASDNDVIEELDVWFEPMGAFSGDMMLSSVLPEGGMRVILCDFTGHGLPAALGAVPVASIYSAITVKNLPLEILMNELNNKLKTLLPTGIFCCCAGIDIDLTKNSARIWNSGLPVIMMLDQQGNIKKRFSSSHLPLGVMTYLPEKVHCDEIELEVGDSFYLYSDGLTETTNKQGEQLGIKGFETLLTSADSDEKGRVRSIKNNVKAFIENEPVSDDLSLIEIKTLVTP